MDFDKHVDLPEQSHESQQGIVLEGKIDLTINNVKETYTKGDSYFIPKGVLHSGKILAGYADVTFFDQRERYIMK